MRLRYAPASPFARKVRVVAIERGLDDRIELVSTPLSPIDGSPSLAAENPLMKVPALVTDDGEVLFDSPVICEYLDSLPGRGNLFPPAGPARWRALRQQALADGILDSVILAASENRLRPEDKRWSPWPEGQLRKVHQGLAALEGEDLSGPLTIGQIAAGCIFGYFDMRYPDDGWRGRHPRLAAWYRDFEARPSMQATKPPAA
jgi:glutathione S-transferase